MAIPEISADARTLWSLLRGQPRNGSHADNLEAFYAPQADRYDACRARLLQGRTELIEQLDLRPGYRVVELGCGTGSSLQMMGNTIHSIQRFDMIDLCPALLGEARKRSAGYRAVNIVEADATTWQPEGAVDIVFMSYSLTMMPQWRNVVANAYSMLAPGGKFGIVDFHLPNSGSRLGNAFWLQWFAHDGVHLSEKHLPLLHSTFNECATTECRAKIPYLPGLRAPYYRFIGKRGA